MMTDILQQIDQNEGMLRTLQKEVWKLTSEVRSYESSYSQYSAAKATHAERKVKAGKEKYLETLQHNQQQSQGAMERQVAAYNKKLEEYQKQYDEDRTEIVSRFLDRQTALDAEEEVALDAVRKSFAEKRRRLGDDEKKAIASKEAILKERTRKIEAKIDEEKRALEVKITTYYLPEIEKLYDQPPVNEIITDTPTYPPSFYKKKDALTMKVREMDILKAEISYLKEQLASAAAAKTETQRREVEIMLAAEREKRQRATAGLRAQMAAEAEYARAAQEREEEAAHVAHKQEIQREADENKRNNSLRAIAEMEEQVKKHEKVLKDGFWIDEEYPEEEPLPLSDSMRREREMTLKDLRDDLDYRKRLFKEQFGEIPSETPSPPSESETPPPKKRVIKLKA